MGNGARAHSIQGAFFAFGRDAPYSEYLPVTRATKLFLEIVYSITTASSTLLDRFIARKRPPETMATRVRTYSTKVS